MAYRKKKVTARKGKRWAKRGSSSSNPETNKHRLAAKSKFPGYEAVAPSSAGRSTTLTVDALAKHEGIESDDDDMGETISNVGSEFFCGSFEGTVFSQVGQKWNSPQASHREACAVLAAINDVITEKGGQHSDTEYFATLITALSGADDEDGRSAIAYLLSLIIPKVPTPVIRSKFSDAAKVLVGLVQQHSSTLSTACHRAVVKCLAVLLQAQEAAVWTNSSTISIFRVLLVYTIHPKPKVRKAGQYWVATLMKEPLGNGSQPPYHPAATHVAKFCVQTLETVSSDSTPALHILGLLKEMFALLPAQSIKALLERILQLMTLSDEVMTSVAMQALHGLFAATPKAAILSPELNAQMITALYDYQPNANDVQPCLAWLAVMQAAHVCLSNLDKRLCSGHLQRVSDAAMRYLLSERPLIRQGAAEFLIVLLRQCVAECIDVLAPLVDSAPKGSVTFAHRIFRCFEAGLQYRYHAVWDVVLQVLGVAFEVMAPRLHSIMGKCLVSLCDLHNTPHFPYKKELQAAAGVAVAAMGPRVFLAAAPLCLEEKPLMMEFPRAWLLPVFRQHVQNTELAFFTGTFVPLSVRLREKAAKLAANKQMLEAKLYQTLEEQIWDLLPGFCRHPTDVESAFPSVAPLLGKMLNGRRDLRAVICRSLQQLIESSHEDESALATIARFCQNYMPVLFNVYLADAEQTVMADPLPEELRSGVLSCLHAFASIADCKLLATYLMKMSMRLKAAETTPRVKLFLFDLAINMVPFAALDSLSGVYKVVFPYLKRMDDSSLQKKAYQLLEAVCSSKKDAHCTFVASHLGELQEFLQTSQSNTSAAAKRPRLKCVAHIVKKLLEPRDDFLASLLPEVILSTKEVNEKTRTLAHDVIGDMARATQRTSTKTVHESTCDFMVMVAGGLAGSSHMMSATVGVITNLIINFRDLVSSDLLEKLLELLPPLLLSKQREVVKPSLGLVRVLVSILSVDQLRPHLETIIKTLLKWTSGSQNPLRLKSRNVFERLVRKFGYEEISKLVPPRHSRLIGNIRKVAERHKRQRREHKEGEQEMGKRGRRTSQKKPDDDDLLMTSDEDMEEDEPDKIDMTVHRGRQKAWIQEGLEEDPVDLLDPSARRHVLTSNPNRYSAKRKSPGFETSEDGKLVINEDIEPQKSEDMMEVDMESVTGSQKAKKRRHSVSDDEDDDLSTVRGGGTGIHRKLPPKRRKEEFKANFGQEYKAKKAGGDIKRKNKPDPYAYLPLNYQLLNKRKRAKAAAMFKGLSKSSRKGSSKFH